MRAAPAIDLPLSAGGWERAAVVLVHAVAGAALGTWLAAWLPGWSQQAPPWPGPITWMVLMASAFALLGAGQGRRMLPPAPRVLRWTGEAWLLGAGSARPRRRGAAAAPAAALGLHWQELALVQLQLDLGDGLLLCCRPRRGPTAWAVASRGQAGAAWHPMAVALRAHAGPGLRRPDTPSGQAIPQ